MPLLPPLWCCHHHFYSSLPYSRSLLRRRAPDSGKEARNSPWVSHMHSRHSGFLSHHLLPAEVCIIKMRSQVTGARTKHSDRGMWASQVASCPVTKQLPTRDMTLISLVGHCEILQ